MRSVFPICLKGHADDLNKISILCLKQDISIGNQQDPVVRSSIKFNHGLSVNQSFKT